MVKSEATTHDFSHASVITHTRPGKVNLGRLNTRSSGRVRFSRPNVAGHNACIQA